MCLYIMKEIKVIKYEGYRTTDVPCIEFQIWKNSQIDCVKKIFVVAVLVLKIA